MHACVLCTKQMTMVGRKEYRKKRIERQEEGRSVCESFLVHFVDLCVGNVKDGCRGADGATLACACVICMHVCIEISVL